MTIMLDLHDKNTQHVAFKTPELLDKVSRHKSIYFRAGWAHYERAIQGQIQLVPSEITLSHFKQDYVKMSDMFYGNPVAWNEMIGKIKEFQNEFNTM